MYDLKHIILHECEVALYTFHANLIKILPIYRTLISRLGKLEVTLSTREPLTRIYFARSARAQHTIRRQSIARRTLSTILLRKGKAKWGKSLPERERTHLLFFCWIVAQRERFREAPSLLEWASFCRILGFVCELPLGNLYTQREQSSTSLKLALFEST